MAENAVWRVGLVGHRDITNPTDIESIRQEADMCFRRWQSEHPVIEVLTLLAIGADTILAKVALTHGARLVLIVPFAEFEKDFTPEELQIYRRIGAQAVDIKRLPEQTTHDDAYRVAGTWLVEQCDAILAIWDGKPSRGPGGVEEIVHYSRRQNKPIIIIECQRSPNSQTATKESDDMSSDLVNMYISILDNTAKISDRRQTTNDIFVGINSLILTALGFLLVTNQLNGWFTAAAFALVSIFTIFIDLIWRTLLTRYSNLLKIRYAYLEELERKIQEEGAYSPMVISNPLRKGGKTVTEFGILSVENKFSGEKKRELRFGFARLEVGLVYFFIGSYAVFTAIVGVLTWLVASHTLQSISF